MHINGVQLAILAVTLVCVATVLPVALLEQPVVTSRGPAPPWQQFAVRALNVRVSLAAVIVGGTLAYLVRSKRPASGDKRRLTKGVCLFALGLTLIVTLTVNVSMLECGHIHVSWFGIPPSHECPYMLPARMLQRVRWAQSIFYRRRGRYATSVHELIEAELIPRGLHDAAEQQGFVTRLRVTDHEWEARSESPAHERVVYATRRLAPSLVPRARLPSAPSAPGTRKDCNQ